MDRPDSDGVLDEARSVYQRFRAVFGGGRTQPVARRRRERRGTEESEPFGPGRDASSLGDALAGLTSSMGWTKTLAQTDLISAWREVAGPDTAAHSNPLGIEDGVLRIACDSTAWATQLRLMRTEIVTRIAQRYPEAGVQNISFTGPGTPGWKRGPRTVPGRGPRDTYG